MSRHFRAALVIVASILLTTAAAGDAQRSGGAPKSGAAPRSGGAPPSGGAHSPQGAPRQPSHAPTSGPQHGTAQPRSGHPAHPPRATYARGSVFVGGYFYDPFFGPYPWWPWTSYPYWYYPVYDTRAELRIRLKPDKVADPAAVYVDGYYAGTAEDFDGVFQGLTLSPGGHSIVVYLEGYRTIRQNVYLSPGSSYKLHGVMDQLPPGVHSEPPEVAPPAPAPPEGTYQRPTEQAPVPPPATVAGAPTQPVSFGTLDLFVQPAGAEVLIDGQPWTSAEEGHFVVRVAPGMHRVQVSRHGFQTFSTTIEIREGESVPLNVSLLTTS